MTTGGADGIGAIVGDMFYGVVGTSPSSSYVINSESDATGTNLLTVGKTGGYILQAPPGTAVISTLNCEAGPGRYNSIVGAKSGSHRWQILVGDSTPEGGSNFGSDFSFSRYSDTGVFISTPMTISRGDGKVSFAHNVSAVGTITSNSDIRAGSAGAVGTYYFGSSGTSSLSYDGVNYQMLGGILNVHAAIISSGTGGINGAVWCNIGQTAGMISDGTNVEVRGNTGAVKFQPTLKLNCYGTQRLTRFLFFTTPQTQVLIFSPLEQCSLAKAWFVVPATLLVLMAATPSIFRSTHHSPTSLLRSGAIASLWATSCHRPLIIVSKRT
jgi:hypothetical protein